MKSYGTGFPAVGARGGCELPVAPPLGAHRATSPASSSKAVTSPWAGPQVPVPRAARAPRPKAPTAPPAPAPAPVLAPVLADVAGDVPAPAVDVGPVDQPCEVCGLMVTGEYIARTGAARHGNHPPAAPTQDVPAAVTADNQSDQGDQELDEDDDVDELDGALRAAAGRLLTVADLQAYLHQMPPSAPVLLSPAGAHGTGARAPLQAAWPALYAADGAPITMKDPADVHFAVVLGASR